MTAPQKKARVKKSTSDQLRPAMRDYAKRWKRLSPVLDSIRHDEIRAVTEEMYLRIMDQLWEVSVSPTRRLNSGLVEFQKRIRR